MQISIKNLRYVFLENFARIFPKQSAKNNHSGILDRKFREKMIRTGLAHGFFIFKCEGKQSVRHTIAFEPLD